MNNSDDQFIFQNRLIRTCRDPFHSTISRRSITSGVLRHQKGGWRSFLSLGEIHRCTLHSIQRTPNPVYFQNASFSRWYFLTTLWFLLNGSFTITIRANRMYDEQWISLPPFVLLFIKLVACKLRYITQVLCQSSTLDDVPLNLSPVSLTLDQRSFDH